MYGFDILVLMDATLMFNVSVKFDILLTICIFEYGSKAEQLFILTADGS